MENKYLRRACWRSALIMPGERQHTATLVCTLYKRAGQTCPVFKTHQMIPFSGGGVRKIQQLSIK
jgi:hypothetical protein